MLTAITVHLQLVGVGDNSNAVIVAPDCCSTSTSAAAVSEVCAFVLIILLTVSSQGQTQRLLLTASQGHFTPMSGENRELVTDDPVEFEK